MRIDVKRTTTNEKTRVLAVLLILVAFPEISECSTHWKVTELGRIESNEDSPFTLLRPYDLASFLQQIERSARLDELKKIIISKDIPTGKDPNSAAVSSYQEKFYSTDADCLRAGQELTKFSFFETYLISWLSQGLTLPKDVMQTKLASIKEFKKPYCDSIDLPFNMGTYDHFESIQSKDNITMYPEVDFLKSIFIEPEEYFGHLVHLALLTNGTSWVFLTMASQYFRLVGDYPNAVKCLQRALYYSSKTFINIPRLSFSNLLHKLNFINESLSVMMSNIAENMDNSVFAYYIGNIYLTLGELKSSLEWYERASRIDTKFELATLKKHAVACHIKLEAYLEDQHDNLQKKLDQLKDYQSYSDEWFHVSSKFELERSSPNRKQFTRDFYNEFRTKTKSNFFEYDSKVIEFRLLIGLLCNWNVDEDVRCKILEAHYSYFPFNVRNLSQAIEEITEMETLERLLKEAQSEEETNSSCSDSNECTIEEKSSLNNNPVKEEEKSNVRSDELLKESISKEKSINARFRPPRNFIGYDDDL